WRRALLLLVRRPLQLVRLLRNGVLRLRPPLLLLLRRLLPQLLRELLPQLLRELLPRVLQLLRLALLRLLRERLQLRLLWGVPVLRGLLLLLPLNRACGGTPDRAPASDPDPVPS